MPDSTEIALSDLLRILVDSASWCLPPEHWDEIEELLAQAADLICGGPIADIRKVIGDLILVAPDRVSKRISAAESAPPRIRERINVLVQSIEAPPGARCAVETETSVPESVHRGQ